MNARPETNEAALEAGLNRLRASREAFEEALVAEGDRLGRLWALEYGEADQVERVASLHVMEGGFGDGEPWNGTWSSVLIAAICKGEDERGDYGLEFAERFLNRDDEPPVALLRGFVEGVAEIFDSI